MVLWGIGQGQAAVSGTLAHAEMVGTSTTYPVSINLPNDVDTDLLRLGMVGTATVFSDKAGPIGALATVLLWVRHTPHTYEGAACRLLNCVNEFA